MSFPKPPLPYIVAGAAVAATGLGLWAINRAKRWRPGSKTAQIACFMRFLATYETDEKFKVSDPFAKHFIPSYLYWIGAIAPNYTRRKFIEDQIPGGYGWVLARTILYDRVVEKGCANGVKQLVILGAGYDARPYRIPCLKNIRVFEVDQSETQKSKQDIVERVVPAAERTHVTFVPINFNKETLEGVLSSAGYDKTQKTLFLWEAVTQYISHEAVENVLKFVHEHSTPGSLIAFDYKYQEALDGTKIYTGIGMANIVKFMNEPYVFGLPEGQVSKFLDQRGFDVEAINTPATVRDEILTDPKTGRNITVMGFQDLVVAKNRH